MRWRRRREHCTSTPAWVMGAASDRWVGNLPGDARRSSGNSSESHADTWSLAEAGGVC